MDLKKEVGYKAVEYIKSGMVVGLGTGSTATYMVEALGKRVAEENLDVTGVTTSNKTEKQAQSLDIPLKNLDDVDHIDLTIDGADEISKDGQGLKGGGGSLLYEKLVASRSEKNIWIVDESKLVDDLGAFPLPVEVVKLGSSHLYKQFEDQKREPSWRLDEEGNKFITDDGNYIIDLRLEKINEPSELSSDLNNLTGVVENGLFLDIVDTVIVGTSKGVEVKEMK